MRSRILFVFCSFEVTLVHVQVHSKKVPGPTRILSKLEPSCLVTSSFKVDFVAHGCKVLLFGCADVLTSAISRHSLLLSFGSLIRFI